MTQWTCVFSCFFMLLINSNAAMAKTKIDLYWKYISYEISPLQARHETQIHADIVLDGDTVSFGNYSGNLGEVFNGSNGSAGGEYTARVTVQGGFIDAEVQFSGSRLSEKIRSSGSNTCSAAVSYSRIRGQKFFTGLRKSNSEPMTMTKEEASDVYCTIVRE